MNDSIYPYLQVIPAGSSQPWQATYSAGDPRVIQAWGLTRSHVLVPLVPDATGVLLRAEIIEGFVALEPVS